MSGVLFNGQNIIRPQAAVAAVTSGLTPVVLGSPDIIHMFGPATGGVPNTILEFSSPQDAVNALLSGDLLTAMLAAWNASKQEAGASTIRATRVNPALQSALTVNGAKFANLNWLSAASVLLFNIQDLVGGTAGNAYSVTVSAGTASGYKIILVGASTYTYDNQPSIAAMCAAINAADVGFSATFFSEATPVFAGPTDLAGGLASTALAVLTSQDYGIYTASISVTIGAGTVSGYKLTTNLPSLGLTEVFDNCLDAAALVAAVNAPVTGSVLVSASLTADGTPASLVAVNLVGGSEGTLTNTNWTNGFDLINSEPSDLYYAASSDSSVFALLYAQVEETSNTKYPGFAAMGHALGLSLSAIQALQAPYASANRAICTAGGIAQYNAAGVQTVYANYLTFAPQMLGLIAGLALNREATYKTLSGLGLEINWSSAQLDTLDQSGICAIENVPNVGLRITDGQTTWTQDLNVMSRSISAGRIRDVIQQTLYTALTAFIGEPGTKYTLTGIKAKVDSLMLEAQNNGLITAGYDDAGNAQPAWLEPSVSFNSATQVVTVNVQCSPVTTIRYALATTSFVGVNISA